MANKDKNKIREQTKNRARIFRGIQSILKQDNIALVNTIQLKNKILNPNSSTSSEKVEPPRLPDALRLWAIDYKIKRRALTALLKLLISFGARSLPRDSRSLLKTPRFVEIKDQSGGQYWHNGFEKAISQVFCKLSSNLRVEINLNLDGLPLGKSSKTQFWPILANFHGV